MQAKEKCDQKEQNNLRYTYVIVSENVNQSFVLGHLAYHMN